VSVQHRHFQNPPRRLDVEITDTPKTLPWTDKFCHFVRFDSPVAGRLRAKGKKDSDMYLPEVAIPSLALSPWLSAISVPLVVSCTTTRYACQSVAPTSHSWFSFAPWRLCVENLSTPTLPPTHRATYPFALFQPTEVVSCRHSIPSKQQPQLLFSQGLGDLGDKNIARMGGCVMRYSKSVLISVNPWPDFSFLVLSCAFPSLRPHLPGCVMHLRNSLLSSSNLKFALCNSQFAMSLFQSVAQPLELCRTE
jgi:hypothetical protein